jgi:Tfp pilus assembly PilM family ATPase
MRWMGIPFRTPIGLDLGQRYLKAVQLSRQRGGWRVEAVACMARPEPAAPTDSRQVRALREMLRRQGFAGKDVVLGVPRQKQLTGILELPARDSGAPLDQIARMELARIHKCAPGSFEMVYWDVPAPNPARGAARVMAAAVAHAEAEPLLDAFEGEGLNVRALDLPACAIARACRPALADDPAITCVVDMGWGSSRVFILYRGVVVYERTLGETGVKRLSEALNRRLGLDLETTDSVLGEVGLGAERNRQEGAESFDELHGIIASHLNGMVEELQASFTYALHQYRDAALKRVLLIGGGAAVPGAASRLASALSLDVQPVAPARVAHCSPPLVETCGNPALMMAAGLAQFAEK